MQEANIAAYHMLSMQQDNNEIDCNIRCYTVNVLTGLQMKVSKLNKKIRYLFLNRNICCGY